MKSYKDIKEIANNYIKNNNENGSLFDPIFYIDNNKLCLMYLVCDFVDKDNDDYRIKRPTKWFTQDLKSGDILNFYTVDKNDFSTSQLIPFDTIYENAGASYVYNDVNNLLSELRNWGFNEKIKFKNLKNHDIDNVKIIRNNGENLSPREYILNNIDTILNNLMYKLYNDLGNPIEEGLYEYYEYLFDIIRNDYLKKNKINKEKIKDYMNLLKYSWPDMLNLINNSSNITDTADYDFDNMIKKNIIC